MADTATTAELLVDSTGNSWLDTFLHYGLLLGAIFQLICIFAVVIIPQSEDEKDDFEDDHQLASPKHAEVSSKRSKHEKKKRR